jgi:adenine deaminase
MNMEKSLVFIEGNLVDVWKKSIYPARVYLADGKIEKIEAIESTSETHFILPGFTDSHVHIESSLLIPSEFARLAVIHGTVSTISDPHEIANVCGLDGIEFMIQNGEQVNFKFNFGAPSCVPATVFETAGDTLNSQAVSQLLKRTDILYLSEMMNFPGVLQQDAEVMAKIAAAHALGKPVDGHAPGLRQEAAQQYIDAISLPNKNTATDHECFTEVEALDKLERGMKIIIREGSAAKNFDALISLLNNWPDQMMFCSDDKHPDSLLLGHINQLCSRAVAKGVDLFNILQAACINPVLHYKTNTGLLRVGDAADFVVVDNLQDFTVLQTWINGELVAQNGESFLPSIPVNPINRFNCTALTLSDVALPLNAYPEKDGTIPVIEALDGQLITNQIWLAGTPLNNCWISNTDTDILKMVVVNRYQPAPIAKAFIKNFGLQKGALASSVAHDSHNIVAVGCDDESLIRAINLVIEQGGGLSAVASETEEVLGLPVAGLMTHKDAYHVAAAYTRLDRISKDVLGSTLQSPFMTLSFMALLVIPHLKLSDKGLFNGDLFEFVSL